MSNRGTPSLVGAVVLLWLLQLAAIVVGAIGLVVFIVWLLIRLFSA